MKKTISKEIDVGDLELLSNMHTSLEHFKKIVDKLYAKYPNLIIEKEYSYSYDDFDCSGGAINSIFYYNEEEITEEELKKLNDKNIKMQIDDVDEKIKELKARRKKLLERK